MKLFTSAQMRGLDQQAIDGGVPSLTLMENAGRAVVEHAVRRYGPLAGKRVAVVCGKGNNGGDGLVAARLLYAEHHVMADVSLAADPGGLSGDAAANYRRAVGAGVRVTAVGEAEIAAGLGACDLVVDAVLGTGIQGPATGLAAAAIEAINAARVPVVAIDVPSGADADSGAVAGPAVRASSTVTLAAAKLGLSLYPAAAYAGDVEIADIGFPSDTLASANPAGELLEPGAIAALLPPRDSSRDANKGTYGHVTIIAGSAGFLGAAVLSSAGAARAGAGLVTLAVPRSLLDPAMATALPVVMTLALVETPARRFCHEGLDAALRQAARGSSAAIGPGIGGQDDTETTGFVIEFIRSCPVPLVVDADALNILSAQPDQGANIVGARTAPTFLTPHPGEMGRLLGTKTAEVQADRLAAVRRAAGTFRCAVALKGSRTLVAGPDGPVRVNPTGNAGMATGGTGDVLTGVAATLIGQIKDPVDALAAAVYIHGLAGDIAAERLGRDGLIATDVIDDLPAAFRRVRGG